LVALARPHRAPDHAQTSRLILASNRGPIEHYVAESGSIRQRDAGGGVAVALRGVAGHTRATWVAAACSFGDQIVARTGRVVPFGRNSSLRLLPLPPETYEPFYQQFCNPLLWFVQHSLGEALLDEHRGENALDAWREGYVPVNRAFAAAICEEIERPGGRARVMLHDYHLYLAPRMIRARHPHTPIQQFVHIPWPAPDTWSAMPACIVRQICLGLLGNDSLAFQDDRSAENFKATCAAYLDGAVEVSPSSPYVRHESGQTFVWTNPISVDVTEVRSNALPAVDNDSRLKTIVRVDRLDPAKNALRGFEAYERLLQRRPDMLGNVQFVACFVPSRTGIGEYDAYADQTLALAGAINARYGTPGWEPIKLLLGNDRSRALAWMANYDVLLVNSIADGMNLVCKEGPVINRRDGCLVLSRQAGAHRELAQGAVSIDPFDVDDTADALERALDMPLEERRVRMSRLRLAIDTHQLSDWLRALLKDLDLTAHEKAPAVTRSAS
jgi:trehalose 6-phosphate synthase